MTDAGFREKDRAGARGPRAGRWIAHGPAALLVLVSAGVSACAMGCAAPVEGGAGGEPTGSTSEAIYGGQLDDDSAAYDGVVAIRAGDDPQAFALCTGALIAPSVVLTARHCVATGVVANITCDENGESPSGPQVGADIAAASLHIYTGAEPNIRYGVPAANGKTIFHPGTSVLCNSDIAVVILDHALDLEPIPLRLTAATRAGETVRAIGYGQNDQGMAVGTRFRRSGVAVKSVGIGISASGTPLASHEMEVGKSICQGDSGGPAISDTTGAIVGVVSRGGACGDDFGHVYTLTDGFVSLISQALASAGEAPLEEPVGPVAAHDGGVPSSGSGSGNGSGGTTAPTADAGTGGHTSHATGTSPVAAKGCAASVAGAGGADHGSDAGATWALAGVVVLAGARRKRRA